MVIGTGLDVWDILELRGIERWLELRPDQADRSDFPAILDRRFARRQPKSPERRPLVLDTAMYRPSQLARSGSREAGAVTCSPNGAR